MNEVRQSRQLSPIMLCKLQAFHYSLCLHYNYANFGKLKPRRDCRSCQFGICVIYIEDLGIKNFVSRFDQAVNRLI